MADEEKKEPVRDFNKGIYKNINKKIAVLAGDFPYNQAVEWLDDCNGSFDRLRWLKMWTDHLKAKAYDNQVIEMQQPQEQEKPKEESKTERIPVINPVGYVETSK